MEGSGGMRPLGAFGLGFGGTEAYEKGRQEKGIARRLKKKGACSFLGGLACYYGIMFIFAAENNGYGYG